MELTLSPLSLLLPSNETPWTASYKGSCRFPGVGKASWYEISAPTNKLYLNCICISYQLLESEVGGLVSNSLAQKHGPDWANKFLEKSNYCNDNE